MLLPLLLVPLLLPLPLLPLPAAEPESRLEEPKSLVLGAKRGTPGDETRENKWIARGSCRTRRDRTAACI